MMEYKTYKVTLEGHVAHVAINRPEKANALNQTAWEELQQVFEDLDANKEVRAIVLSGEGKHFCSGIDLGMLMEQASQKEKCEGRKREAFYHSTAKLQDRINAIEKCRKPVIAAIHKACVGGGVDVVSACDMRFCTDDAFFSIKEVDVGLVADLGTLQRLPKILNPGIVAEMAFTGRNVEGAEAKEIGLVNRTFSDKETMMEEVTKLAQMIAEKSPLVVRGIKENLLYSRDHSVDDSLKFQVLWNSATIISDDLMEAMQSSMQKRKPEFNG
ncbi:crotonase/enoyl-CoA hydratase family protein [bacterium]|nr:crotonase/enoyl-CoA hydratase family protein [bacterium]